MTQKKQPKINSIGGQQLQKRAINHQDFGFVFTGKFKGIVEDEKPKKK